MIVTIDAGPGIVVGPRSQPRWIARSNACPVARNIRIGVIGKTVQHAKPCDIICKKGLLASELADRVVVRH